MIFHYFTKTWKWSYGQYAHSGIRVRQKTRKNDKIEETAIFLKNSSLDSKADFWKKSTFGIWRLILTGYDRILNIEHIILTIQYMKTHIRNRYQISRLSRFIISNFLAEYVVFLVNCVFKLTIFEARTATAMGHLKGVFHVPQCSFVCTCVFDRV